MSAIDDIKERKAQRIRDKADLEEFRAMKRTQEANDRKVSEQKAYYLGAADVGQAVEEILSQRGGTGLYTGDKTFDTDVPKEGITQDTGRGAPSFLADAISTGRDAVSGFISNVVGPTPEKAERNAQLGAEMQQIMEQELINEAIFNAKAEGNSSEGNINKHINILKGNR